MIDQSTIERIIDTADVVDVVGEFVSLKKRGVNYLGLCPFHNEKTPSFTVSPAKGIFKCFGCGKGGNSVHFVMEHEQMTYPESLRFLAKKYNIEIVEKELTPDEIEQKNIRESLLIVSTYAQKYFTNTLHSHPDGKAIGLSYFKERGFRDDIIEKFQLGYCIDKKDEFTLTAINKGYKLDYLVKTGLTIQGDNYSFDRFNGRVIFPIHGLAGKVIGFGGRTLKTDKKVAKYLNSPESDIYHKSKILYGIHYAKKSIIQEDKCYLVEGYTDVISLHQAGIENVIASSGTSLTIDQILLIKRFTKNITILYDGDPAGIKASLRGIDLILEEGLNVKVLLLPEGEDPDSYAKKYTIDEVLKFIKENEKDFIEFKTQLLLKDAENDPVKKANLITDIVRSIAMIPDNIIRSVYVKECSSLLSIDEHILYSEIDKVRRKGAEKIYKKTSAENFQTAKTHTAQQQVHSPLNCDSQEKEIVRLLLNYGTHELFEESMEDEKEEQIISVAEFIIREIQNDIELSVPIYKQIFEEYQHHLINKEKIDEKYFTNHADESVSKLAADLLTEKYTDSKIWSKRGSFVETAEDKLKEIIPKTIIEYKNIRVKILLEQAGKELKEALEKKEEDKIKTLYQQFIALSELKKKISKELGDRIIL